MPDNQVRILIAEHDALVAAKIEDCLIKLGYEVCGRVGRGENVAAFIAEEQPDLVLIDIQLPGDLGGINVANQLKERYDVPIILLSADPDEELIHQALDAESYSCLVEPFAGCELHDTIQDALEKHSLHHAMGEANELLWERSIVAIVRAEPNGRYLAANPAAVRLYGFESERDMLEAVPDPTNDIYVRPEERDHLVSMIREGAEAIGVDTEIYSHGKRDTIWIRQNIWPAHDGDGRLLFLEGYMEDITEKKKAELALATLNATLERKVEERTAALAGSERQYRAILDNMLDTYYRADAEGRIIMISPSVQTLTGYSQDEVIGKFLAKFYADPAERAKFLQQLEQNNGVVEAYEALMRHKNGEPIWVSTSARYVLDDKGRVVGIEGTSRDISERKKADDALGKSEGQLRLIIDNLPILITYVDTNEKFLYVNQTCADWYNQRQEEIAGKSVADIHGDNYPLFKPRIDAVLSGESFTFEDRNLYPDGVWRDIRSQHVPQFDAAGVVQGYFSFTEDITERKNRDEQLRQAQKMEAVGQLTGGIAHDFNNILAVMMGNLSLLDQELGAGHEYSTMLEPTMRAGERASELTHRMLAYARVQPLSVKAVDANAVLEGAEHLLRRSLTEEIEIEFNMASDLITCLADPGQLEQAVLNLAINARDAMPEGGRLRIETANASLPQAGTNGDLDVMPGEYVMIAVTDTGTGIPAENLAQIFEPFFTTKDVGKGTGLGLSMVYGFVKQSRGDIIVESGENTGTTFKIFLPCATETAVEAEQPREAQAVSARAGETIVLVEDDPDVQAMAARALKRNGYRVLVASTGPEGLDILSNQPHVDLLLTDVTLPGGLNGRQIAEKARILDGSLKVLFMSGYSKETIVEGRRLLPDIELLAKPFLPSELMRRIREILDD
ncbi:MAG: PAS domain S-box protein [Rhodospirillaceae bacterium]|nr:PAS domain S-box protein [Rhodospirillaceae bacterium]MBT5080816.1 PAS domain S-box protein [Rhodospirillaceae bacterium]MBT5525237.1 PAS domain S-box protein [Rhodospirillaceae bacterium]MBT5877806.1 PAS domain S-box protein [Rhodospirillaceae bacterium]MBT6587969.1 PAS domain S-box protein [Rhodospirillaceae bacterium]